MTTNPIVTFAKKSVSAFLVLTIASLAVALPRSASAQTTAQPLDDPLNGESRGDIFSNRGNGQPGSMLDIIHRAMQGQGQSAEDFQAAQNENLDDATAQFLKLRQQQLRNSAGTTTPTPAPSTTTP